MVLWLLDLQLPVLSVPIITKVVSSNPVHGELCSIQHYVIKFVSDLRQVGGFIGNFTTVEDYNAMPMVKYSMKNCLNNLFFKC
jgi:hypothetical protein